MLCMRFGLKIIHGPHCQPLCDSILVFNFHSRGLNGKKYVLKVLDVLEMNLICPGKQRTR
jgi:hypothetical protein